jgi:hypothetical protein
MNALARTTFFAAVTIAAFAGGCAHHQTSQWPPRTIEPASAQRTGMTLDRVKKLEGAWTMKDEKGTEIVASVFTVSSGGTVVREVMFPGSEHEMTNVYHMDGADIIVTHYCAAGNQPRMRCTSPGLDRLTFEYDSVSNYVPGGFHGKSGFMGKVALVFIDNDHVNQVWTHYVDGQAGEPMTFALTRKK